MAILLHEGRKRVIIEDVTPQIEGGRYKIKRTVGETIVVEADVFTDGHDSLSCALLYRCVGATAWQESKMEPMLGKYADGEQAVDRWRATFTVSTMGEYEYTVTGWVDHFKTWRRDLQKRVAAGQDVAVELLVGAKYIEAASKRATDESDAEWLRSWAAALRKSGSIQHKIQVALDDQLDLYMRRYPDRETSTTYEKTLRVVVERERARFSAWYELFPRSWSFAEGVHGTFKDCEARLPYIADMGFDIIYFPPIHPIGETFRKGKNNALLAAEDDHGSPWAIGAAEGGHKAVHPLLGTLEDFRHLVQVAKETYNIDIALDIAFQCSPDHPYVKEHPEWFLMRPDGTIQYAENPPKKYQDIYPFFFETEQWQELWQELKSIFTFWIEQGVTVFRVDNPHTKAFGFWEWAIGEIKAQYPEIIFLAEAFTRPKIMYNLAKLGFTQSYTYFAWRNTKTEITDYLTTVTQTEVREFFRPNYWPNTPDILNEYLQTGGRPAFMIRLILAATLGASYGVYGAAFELCDNIPREQGSEEYKDSEKYQIKTWNLSAPHSLRFLIAQINRIRREQPALQKDWNVVFHPTDNEQVICYSKHTDDQKNIIIVAVNLDPYHTHSAWVKIQLKDIGLDTEKPYQVHDLLDDSRYLWSGQRNFVQLNPLHVPAHIFCVRRHIRTEQDFDYYL
jgi:starch synthase (maltosyl-transferring)